MGVLQCCRLRPYGDNYNAGYGYDNRDGYYRDTTHGAHIVQPAYNHYAQPAYIQPQSQMIGSQGGNANNFNA